MLDHKKWKTSKLGQFDTICVQNQMSILKVAQFRRAEKMYNWAHARIVPLEKHDFHTAFRPIYYFSRYMGLWPFSVAHYSKKKIRRASVALVDIFRSISTISLSSTLVMCAYEEIRTQKKYHMNTIRFVVFMAFQLSSFSFLTIGIVLDLINRNRLADILRKFNTFDRKVNSRSSNSNLDF